MSLLLRHPRGLAKSEAMQKAAAIHFAGNERLSPAEQVNIYRQQFWLRHTSALVEDFPGLTRLLGQKSWEPIAESYLSLKSNDTLALKDLGRNMAQHLRSLPERTIAHLGIDRLLLVEMAELEWAYLRAFDLCEHPPLSLEKLAKIPADDWGKARFLLSPTLSLFRFQYPVADLRRSFKAASESLSVRGDAKEPHNLVVYRRERTLWDKRVSNAAFLLLEQFHKGTPLVPACEAIVAADPSAEQVLDEQLTEWFTLWGRLGWIVDVLI
jgi:hypothetical protein